MSRWLGGTAYVLLKYQIRKYQMTGFLTNRSRVTAGNIDTPGKSTNTLADFVIIDLIDTVIFITSHESLDSLPRNKAAKQLVIVVPTAMRD